MRGRVRSGEASNLSPPLKQIPFYVFCMRVWGREGGKETAWVSSSVVGSCVGCFESISLSVIIYCLLGFCPPLCDCLVFWLFKSTSSSLLQSLPTLLSDLDVFPCGLICGKWPRLGQNKTLLKCVGFALRFCLFITLSKAQKIISYLTPLLAFNGA